MRELVRNADRRVVTSAAITATAITVIATVGLTIDNEPTPPDPAISHLAETQASVPTVTETPETPAPAPDADDERGSDDEHADPGAAHIRPAVIPDGPLGIPGIALDAYHRAADRLGGEQPACEMDWTLLAGIGQVESNQGNGRFDAEGNTIGRILGPRLDGSLEGTAVIKDTDGGRFDGDPEYDRAVGPVQFIPSTWATLGRDGNDDGVADPNNIYDGALAAATLLCNQGGSMNDPAARTRAILAYNNSLAYVANVNAWAHGYAVEAYPLPSDLPEIHRPEPVVEPPEDCPEGWEGEPTAAPEPGEPVPGCTEVTNEPPPPPTEPEPRPEESPEPLATTPEHPPARESPAPHVPAPPPGLPEIELPCIPPFCPPPPA